MGKCGRAIGSVHWIDDEAPFGRPFFVAHEGEWAWAGYFREMAELARADNFDVIGHIDLIKRELGGQVVDETDNG